MGIKLTRRGHSRSTLSKSILLDGEVAWDRHEEAVILKVDGVTDFNGPAKHDYTLLIPRRECALILKALAEAVLEKGDDSAS